MSSQRKEQGKKNCFTRQKSNQCCLVAVKMRETRSEQQTSNDLICSLHLKSAVCHCMHVGGTACLQMLCNIVMATSQFTFCAIKMSNTVSLLGCSECHDKPLFRLWCEVVACVGKVKSGDNMGEICRPKPVSLSRRRSPVAASSRHTLHGASGHLDGGAKQSFVSQKGSHDMADWESQIRSRFPDSKQCCPRFPAL